MRAYEIKGFWGLVVFVMGSVLVLAAAISVPVLVVWVTWNALVGDLFHGPFLSLWQAALLAAILALAFKIVFQPQISLELKRVRSPEELEQHLRQFKDQDPRHDA